MEQSLKHGGPGITSTILGASGIVLFLITLQLIGLFVNTNLLCRFTYSLLGTLVIIDTLLLAWGLVLGIKGFYRKQYKAFFSILGIILNSLMLFFIVGSIVRHLIMKYLI